jgi:hypothetical protein
MALAGSLIGGAGCGALDDKPKSIGDFCGEYAKIECEPTAATCSRTRAECEPIRKAACQSFVAPLQDASRVFRSDNADACLEQLKNTYKKSLITAADLAALTDKCSRVVEGPGVMNASCAVDQDCRSPLVCDKKRCGPLRVVSPGGNCANPGEVCPASEYCHPAEGLMICSARPGKDAACGAELPCNPTLRCSGTTCVEKVAANGACAADADCQSGYCNPYPPSGVGRTCLPGLSFAPFAPSCDAYFGPSSTTPMADAGTAVVRGTPVAGP